MTDASKMYGPDSKPSTTGPAEHSGRSEHSTSASPLEGGLYDPEPYVQAVADKHLRAGFEAGLEAPRRQELTNQVLAVVREGVPSGVATLVADKYLGHEIAAATRTAEPDEADVKAIEARHVEASQESRRRLQAVYGAERAEELLQRSRRYVQAHPALAKLLDQHGLESQVDIVEAITEHVHRSDYRG